MMTSYKILKNQETGCLVHGEFCWQIQLEMLPILNPFLALKTKWWQVTLYVEETKRPKYWGEKTRHRVWYIKNFVDKFRWKCFWFWILSSLWRQSEVSCGWQRAQKASSNQRNCTKNHQKIFIFFSANLLCQNKSTKSVLEP